MKPVNYKAVAKTLRSHSAIAFDASEEFTAAIALCERVARGELVERAEKVPPRDEHAEVTARDLARLLQTGAVAHLGKDGRKTISDGYKLCLRVAEAERNARGLAALLNEAQAELKTRPKLSKYKPNAKLWKHADGSTEHTKTGPLGCPMCADLRRADKLR